MAMQFDSAAIATGATGIGAATMSKVKQAAERKASVTRDEAEVLFVMDRAGEIGGDGFVELAVRAVRDMLVTHSEPAGSISEPDVDWLLGMVGDRPTAFGRAVVFAVVKACDSAPPRLLEVAMRAAVGRCLLV